LRIGVLGLQGDYEEHIYLLRKAMGKRSVSGEVIPVKDRSMLRGLSGIVIPGGESTVIGRLIERSGMTEELREMITQGLPTLGTCAGAILMAKRVRDRVVGEVTQPLLGVMSIGVVRNAFGRQRESFETEADVEGVGRIRAIFIRAPAIVEIWGNARSLSSIEAPDLGKISILAIEGSMIASAFHPEISGETAIHEMFIDIIKR